MKRVLLIAYAYPPCHEIGALRPAGLAKYLPRFGWEPTVLTVKLPGPRPGTAQVVETGDEDVLQTWKMRFGLEGKRGLHEQLGLPVAQQRDSRLVHTKILFAMRYLLTFPDATKGWIPFALRAIEDIKKSMRVDAIVTTSPPVSAHMIGRKAKEMLGCPWIADLRDLWSQNLAQGNDLVRRLERSVERKTLRNADALVSVSEPWADRLRGCYPGKVVFSITNGFDADDFRPKPEALTPTFTITYTGRLYEGKRDPTPLFEAVQELIREGAMEREAVRVRFYGSIEPWLPVVVKSFGLEDIVQVAGVVSREEALQRQRESQALLMLCWSDLRETGQHTGKVFEYLGARRPVLAIGGSRGVVSDLLEQTKTGVHARSKEELKATLRAWYTEYRQIGQVLFRGEERKIRSYTHEEMASQFAHILEGVTGGRISQASAAHV
jgi:glycosyltransferase involved in cell wall biosynthesis